MSAPQIRNILGVSTLCLVVCGCAHRPKAADPGGAVSFTVSLPRLTLEKDETIQSVEMEIEGGQVTRMNQFPLDWSINMRWDGPELLLLSYQAGHFSAGLPGPEPLNDFITVQAAPALDFDLRATISTDRPDPAGASHEKKYSFCKTNLVLRITPERGQQSETTSKHAPLPEWLTTYPPPPIHRTTNAQGEYIVQKGDTLAAIAAAFQMTPQELLAFNPGTDPTRLQVGQKLRLRPANR